MRARCPQSRVLCRAILPDHVLVFRGFSRDWEGAVATVEPAPGEVVHGVVFEVTPADVQRVAAERLDPDRAVTVVLGDGGEIREALNAFGEIETA